MKWLQHNNITDHNFVSIKRYDILIAFLLDINYKNNVYINIHFYTWFFFFFQIKVDIFVYDGPVEVSAGQSGLHDGSSQL